MNFVPCQVTFRVGIPDEPLPVAGRGEDEDKKQSINDPTE